MNNVPFRVIGVLERKGQSAWGQDQDDVVMVPLVAGRRNILGRNPATARAVGSISVKVTDARMMSTAMTEIRAVLRERHRLQPDQDDDFAMHDSGRDDPGSGLVVQRALDAPGRHRLGLTAERRRRES